MKKNVFAILILLCLLYCLFFPQKMAHAAAEGLLLWYQNLLPTLLPFSIFSNIIVRTSLYDTWFFKISRYFRKIYPLPSAGIYPLAAGFVFGFPMGSKICADLWAQNKLSQQEAERICCISNTFGPAFLCSCVLPEIANSSLPAWFFLSACYLPPLLLGWIWMKWIPCQDPVFEWMAHKTPAPRFQLSFKIIDAGIMDGFTTMIKLAGYIMMFAILSDFLHTLPFHYRWMQCLFTGFLEITNGIHRVAESDLPSALCNIMDIGFIHFGGLCGLFQTASMMKPAGLRLNIYLYFKILCSLSGLSMILLFYFLSGDFYYTGNPLDFPM